jgi:F-type H+-transporting ATPase subunit b
MLTFPPDYTFLVQIVSFLILWQLLRRLAWAPMLRVLEERDERTIGYRKLARQERTAAEQAAQRYEEEFARARAVVMAELQNARNRIASEEQALLAEARTLAQQTLQATREQLARDRATARQEFARQAEVVGKAIAQQVLGRSWS